MFVAWYDKTPFVFIKFKLTRQRMQNWVLASNNLGKLAEFQTLFDEADLGAVMLPQSHFDITEADETGLSFVENALIKARHASRQSGLPAIADDSGLCVPCLGLEPHIYSARYAGVHGDDTANIDKLLGVLAPKFAKGETVQAFFVCSLVFVAYADDPLPIIAQGVWHGQIVPPVGEGGFGYDPIFWLPDLGKTAAELSKDQKNALSHRGQALRQLVALLG